MVNSRNRPLLPSLSGANLDFLRRPTNYGLIILALALWLSLLVIPTWIGGEDPDNMLDISFQQSYGYFLKNNLQAGKDYSFTYGPLGYFWTFAYDSELFWYRYGWEVLVNLVFTLVILWFTRYFQHFLTKVAFCLLIMVFLPHTDSHYLLPILLIGIMTIKEDRRSIPYFLAIALALAVFALIKFTFLLYSTAVVFFISLNLLRARPRLYAIVPLACFGASLLALWVILGQSLSNLPGYLSGSLQVTTGYSEGMGLEGETVEVYLAVAILAGICLLLFPLAWGSDAGRPGRLRQVSLLGLIAVGVFMQWKHGFVRHDAHSFGFFVFAALIPFLLPATFPNGNWMAWPRVTLLVACLAASGVGILISGRGHVSPPSRFLATMSNHYSVNVTSVFAPSRLLAELESRRDRLESNLSLPATRARIQGAPVDIIAHDQAVLFLNRIKWRPRPVFQSHNAYTPLLLSANGDFFRRDDAPEYVLFKLQPINERLPSLEDSDALRELLWRYHPVLAERSYYLFERAGNSAPPRPEGEVVYEATVGFGQEVDLSALPGGYHTMALRIRPSWSGRIRKSLYKPAPLFITMHTAEGKSYRHRLIPSMAEAGFILNPLLQDGSDVLNLYNSSPSVGKRVISFSLSCAGNQDYEPDIAVTIRRFSTFVSRSSEQRLPGLADSAGGADQEPNPPRPEAVREAHGH